MKKLLLGLCLGALLGFGQTAETIPFRVVLSPKNELPAADLNASGTATLWVHVLRDAGGQVVAGSVDFKVRYQFSGETTITAMHIHGGSATANGPVLIDSGLTRFTNSTGQGVMQYQGSVKAETTAAVGALKGLIERPENYYLNIHTTVYPAGAMRGQLQRAEMSVYLALLDPANELPAVTGVAASATGSLALVTSKDTQGRITSAETIFDLNYTGFPSGTVFTGLHVHTGWPTENGPVTINSGLSGGVAAAESGSGNLHFEAEQPIDRQPTLAAIAGLANTPGAYYMNLHTQANPAGVIRAQTRRTDRMSFPLTLLTANELPPVTGVDARIAARFDAHIIRNNDGQIVAGLAVFDADYLISGEVQFTGMHIHDGTAGENGPVTLDSGLCAANQPNDPGGFGNLYRMATISSAAGLATLNSLSANPERHYFNVHTTANPTGLARSQLLPASSALPVVSAIISAVSDPARTDLAPLGLMTIFGANLFKVPASMACYQNYAPGMVNGTMVLIGGLPAGIVAMTRVPSFRPTDYIVAQVPVGIAPGPHTVIVINSNGPGERRVVPVTAAAPAVYFDANGGIVYKTADMTLVRNDNPARAGETVAILSTGLGQTTPALATGEFPGSSNLSASVTATIGSAPAAVVSSQALPGMPGAYWTVIRVPDGVPAGAADLVLRVGNADSNAVTIYVR